MAGKHVSPPNATNADLDRHVHDTVRASMAMPAPTGVPRDMPRITPARDREIVAPLAAALAVVGVEALRHPLVPEPVAMIGVTGILEPTDVLAALPDAIRQAERAREAERSARAIGLVLVGAALPIGGALAGRGLLPMVALPVTLGLVAGGVGGAIAGWRLAAARLGALLDPSRATRGAAKRLADEAMRTRALGEWGEDGPLSSAAIVTARAALAARPVADDPEDWDALRDALAATEIEVARARSRVAARRAMPAVAATSATASGAADAAGPSALTVAQPADAVLSDTQRALLDALQVRMPTHAR
jgi:hypothetical protein